MSSQHSKKLDEIINEYENNPQKRRRINRDNFKRNALKYFRRSILAGVVATTMSINLSSDMSEKKKELLSQDPQETSAFFHIDYGLYDYVEYAWNKGRPRPNAGWYPPPPGKEEDIRNRFSDTIFFPTEQSLENYQQFLERIPEEFTPLVDQRESLTRRYIVISAPKTLQGKKTYYEYPEHVKKKIEMNEYEADTEKYLLKDLYLFDKEAGRIIDSITEGWSHENTYWHLSTIRREEQRDKKFAFSEMEEDTTDRENSIGISNKENYLYVISTKEKEPIDTKWRFPTGREILLLYGIGIGMSISGIAYANRKNQKTKNLTDLIIENKERFLTYNLLSIIGASAYSIGKIFFNPVVSANAPLFVLNGITMVTATAQLGAASIIGILEKIQTPKIRNLGKGIVLGAQYLMTTDPYKKKSISEIIKDDINNYPTHIGFKLMRKTDSYDEGFEQIRKSMIYSLEKGYEPESDNALMYIVQQISKLANVTRVGRHLSVTGRHTKQENYHKLIKKWDDSKKLLEEAPAEISTLHAHFLETFNKHLKLNPKEEKARQYLKIKAYLQRELEGSTLDELLDQKIRMQWTKAVQEILHDQKTDINLFDGKKTYTIGPSSFLSGTTVLKTNDNPEEVHKEYLNAEKAKNILDDEQLLVANPITVVSYEGSEYFVSRMAKGIRHDRLSGQEAIDAYNALPEALAKIHDKMPGTTTRNLLNVLLERSKDGELARLLHHHYGAIHRELYQDVVFEKDPQERNWFYDAENNITIAIDWDHDQLVPRTWELAKAFTNEYFENNPEQKKHAITTYYGKANKPIPANINEQLDNALIGVAINTKLINPQDPRNSLLLRAAGRSANKLGYEALENIITYLAKS